MARIYSSFAYGSGPRDGCWWDETCDLPQTPQLREDIQVDVAIIGGGFTGLNAALRLSEAGIKTAVLETNYFGWGASGRNGGFCCLGGSKASDAELERSYGRAERLAFNLAEKAAVDHVDAFLTGRGIDVDRHSEGETLLAHRPKDMADMHGAAEKFQNTYGMEPTIISADELASQGMSGGPFFGAMTIPIGFGLNPRKYVASLVCAAEEAGARLFSSSAVTDIVAQKSGYKLSTAHGAVRAENVIVATNGYSSENLPTWLAGRYLPTQSTVLVTRPLSDIELDRQGWTSNQMSYDTRNLVHYFRLMPDRRFLFGMRGGVLTGTRAEATARRHTRAHFELMFPEWARVESAHSWSGLVNLSRHKLPYVGEIPGSKGLWTAMCYHGNGVAMGSFCGKLIAYIVSGKATEDCPNVMRQPLKKFPFGRARRLVVPPLYMTLKLSDTL